MPRALYDLCRAPDSEPVFVSSELMVQTSRQTQDHLLCEGCDTSLSTNGEDWLLPKLATLNDRFLLYEILRKVPPDAVEGDIAIYAAARNPEINVARIVHFAMGIFWKASVHPWKKGRTEPRIELGPYSEKLRMFLRG